MSVDIETTRIVRSWLDEGVTQLPDRVLDAVLDELPATQQRRSTWWPARKLLHTNKAMTFGVAAATVVIVVILGIGSLLPGGLNIGGPGETPTPTPTASPVALPASGALQAGTYAIDDAFGVRVTFVVPAGWQACALSADEIGACTFHAADTSISMGIGFLNVDNVVADPCDRLMPLLDPPVGPSVDDLVRAIADLRGFTATDATDVTLDGFTGKEFEVTAPDDFNGCPVDGDAGFGTWSTPSRTNGVGPGEVNLVRILDVDGVRLVVTAAYFPSIASADEVAEVRRVFESVHIAP